MNTSAYWNNQWLDEKLDPPSSFAKRALPLIQKLKLKTVLDLGCGNGRDALYFTRHGLHVMALDISESGIKSLQSKNDTITCIQGDISTYTGKPNSFDVIFAHLSIQYFNDATTSKIFSRLHSMLNKGGLLFVKCKSTDDPLFGKGEKVEENVYVYDHMRHFFTKKYMAEKLNAFTVLQIRKSSGIHYGIPCAFISAIAQK